MAKTDLWIDVRVDVKFRDLGPALRGLNLTTAERMRVLRTAASFDPSIVVGSSFEAPARSEKKARAALDRSRLARLRSWFSRGAS